MSVVRVCYNVTKLDKLISISAFINLGDKEY